MNTEFEFRKLKSYSLGFSMYYDPREVEPIPMPWQFAVRISLVFLTIRINIIGNP